MDSNTDCGPRLEVQTQRTTLLAHGTSLGFSDTLLAHGTLLGFSDMLLFRFHVFLSFYRKMYFSFMSVHVYVYMCGYRERPEEGVRFPEAGPTGCWEPLRMGAGN